MAGFYEDKTIAEAMKNIDNKNGFFLPYKENLYGTKIE